MMLTPLLMLPCFTPYWSLHCSSTHPCCFIHFHLTAQDKKERIGKNKKQQLNNIKSNLKENQIKDRVPGKLLTLPNPTNSAKTY
jgi:hypothetical protein